MLSWDQFVHLNNLIWLLYINKVVKYDFFFHKVGLYLWLIMKLSTCLSEAMRPINYCEQLGPQLSFLK